MKNPFKKQTDENGLPSIRKRLTRMSVVDLYNQTEASLYHIGHHLSSSQRGGGADSLKSAEDNILGLLEVCRELGHRLG